MKARKITVFLLAVLLCVCPAVCAAGADSDVPDGSVPVEENGSVEEGTLRVAFSEPFQTMDVQQTTDEYAVPLNIFERLFEVRVNEDGSATLENSLAEDYSVSGDGLTYSFTLRDDAFFSDGTKVTASDVAFTFIRMLTLPESVHSNLADLILGSQALMAHETEELEGVRVLDERNLEITLSEPFTGFVYQLAAPGCSILSEKAVTEADSLFGVIADKTIGSGPYMVTEFSDYRVRLERNPYYHSPDGTEPSVQKVEIRFLAPALLDQSFQAGDLDILDTYHILPDVAEKVYLSGKWKNRLVSRRRVEVQYLMLNVKTVPLSDIRVRKAIQMSINRQQLLDTLYGGRGKLLDGIFPEGLIGFTQENQGWLKYDKEEASRIIREIPDASDIIIELAADTHGNYRDLHMLRMIQDDLFEVGLTASIVSYDGYSRDYLRKNGMLMAYNGTWGADYDDPDNFINTYFGSTDKTHNRSSNYDDLTVIDRIVKARTIPDETERLSEYAALEKRLIEDDAVWVPLFSTDHVFVLGDRVQSFTPFWAGWSSMYDTDVVLKPKT